jgi:hypothetical protein
MAFNGTGANVTTLNAANISSGTLAVGRGGTGITSAGTAGNVLTSDGSVFVSQAISAGGNYVQQVYTSPATWTKPTGLKAVRISMIGAGGGGGGVTATGPVSNKVGGSGGSGIDLSLGYLAAPSIPGPVSVTVGAGGTGGSTSGNSGNSGGTTSFGPFMSMTGGGGGTGVGGGPSPGGFGASGATGGYATGPALTLTSRGKVANGERGSPASTLAASTGVTYGLSGQRRNSGDEPSIDPIGFGGGGYSGRSAGGEAAVPGIPDAQAGGNGAAGLIIIEEFY